MLAKLKTMLAILELLAISILIMLSFGAIIVVYNWLYEHIIGKRIAMQFKLAKRKEWQQCLKGVTFRPVTQDVAVSEYWIRVDKHYFPKNLVTCVWPFAAYRGDIGLYIYTVAGKKYTLFAGKEGFNYLKVFGDMATEVHPGEYTLYHDKYKRKIRKKAQTYLQTHTLEEFIRSDEVVREIHNDFFDYMERKNRR